MKSELISEKLNHYRNTGEIGSSKTAVVIDNKYEIVTLNQVSWIRKVGAEKWCSLEAMMNGLD